MNDKVECPCCKIEDGIEIVIAPLITFTTINIIECKQCKYKVDNISQLKIL